MSLEKFETIQQMGRFTLRDEGKTIAVGKVLKYKPFNKGVVGAAGATAAAAAKEVTKQMAAVTINNAVKEDMVFDMETGEMKPKKADMAAIAEGDEDADE